MTTTRTISRRSQVAGDADFHVLLVEDQRALAQMAAKLLFDRWGCHVLIATSLAQVNAIIAENKHTFFVAVSDLNLPDAPRGEVIDVLVNAKIPVIAMTGMYDAQLHERIMSCGVIDYVLKDSINSYEYIVELVGRLFKNRGTRVLVVDDSQSMRALLAGMLTIQGFHVLTACDGAEALTVLSGHNEIKLILLDHEMPVMDGFNFLLAVRRKIAKDRLAIIGMSGTNNPRMSAQFLKLGANDFICKPFSYEELVCRVNQNLEMQESLESVRYIAYHDYLTALFNRRAFFEQGGALFDEAISLGKPLAAAVMDIDFFKKINDLYGHDGGDAVLKQFAALLKAHFNVELVARVGGEEFFLLFVSADEAYARCEAFRLKVEQSAALFGQAAIVYTVSIGITKLVSQSLDHMLKLADDNLYQAKQTGRNRIVLN
ncbi:MAG: diguanylate cyclase [Nitrosomonadales bacterium]|jgi:diguanylate cyclase (GGDEF)-like protein